MKLLIIVTFFVCAMNSYAEEKTPLYAAIAKNDYETVKALLNNGADVNERAEFYGNPLHYIAMKIGMNMNIVRLLIENGAHVNQIDESYYKYAPIHYATGCLGNIEMVKILIKNNANINIRSHCGNTPLHHSADVGRKEFVEL